MSFTLPKLPYELDALAPFLSKEQVEVHYTKHHQGYVNNLNNLTEGKTEATSSLEELIKTKDGGVFNNAAQIWNHTFFWNCMDPNAKGKAPQGKLADAINRDFGSYDAFKEAFAKSAATLFGSGWAWLVADDNGKLELMQLSNADCPLKHGKKPLLTIDVWEHAYYVDYRNLRPKFIEGFWNVVNWANAEKAYEG